MANEVRQVVAELAPAFGGLEVSSVPAGALLYVDGHQVGRTRWSNPEQPSGRYRLRLVNACHADLETEAVVRDGEPTRLDLALRPSCGDLEVTTRPPGATVQVDGVERGRSPVRLSELPEGEHRVLATLPLHAPAGRLVAIAGGKRQTIELPLRPTYGEVAITTQPPGAEVVAGQEVLGTTPFTGRFEAGAFAAVLRKEGYAEQRLELDLRVGETARREVTLRRLLGNLTVLTEPGEAELWLDGERAGRTPTTIRDLPTGEHQLLAKKGELEATTRVVVAAGQTHIERLELVPTTAGALQVDPAIGMRFRYIPAGTFQMGSPPDEPGRGDDERQHQVTLTHGFWLGETEVTQGQWRQLMGSNPSRFSSCGDDCPVEQVSWFDAVQFANALSRRAGREECYAVNGESVTFAGLGCQGYRLPTEAEWEYAARAGGDHRYAGSDSIDVVAWYWDNSDCKTHRAGSKQANGWGLFDMSGNVWEWCWDWYGTYPAGPVTDPLGKRKASSRVFRGGAWGEDPRGARCAYRVRYPPSSRNSILGFRVARSQ